MEKDSYWEGCLWGLRDVHREGCTVGWINMARDVHGDECP